MSKLSTHVLDTANGRPAAGMKIDFVRSPGAGEEHIKSVVTNADGNAASGINNINQALKIIHPTVDDIYFQGPEGQVYEPLSEPPETVYGQGIGSNYQKQGLKLSKHFKAFEG